MKTRSKVFLLVLFFSFVANADRALSLQEYLLSVSNLNQSYLAASLLARSYNLRAGEASVDFMPKLTSQWNYTDNRLIASNPFSPPTSIGWSGSLGVQTKLRTGTQLNFSYNNNFYDVAGLPSFPGSQYTYFIDGPALTLTQPLWQDFAAALSKASEEAQGAGMRAQQFQQEFARQSIYFNAETTYWRLALFREIVNYDKESLSRTEKILKWNQRRVNMNLTDRADLLQAQAAMKVRELQLQTDVEQLREASAQFNSLRNLAGDQVVETLSTVDVALEKIVKELKRTGDRMDVQASWWSANSTKAQADLNREKFKPQVNLTATAQLSGRDTSGTSLTTAISNSWTTNNPLYVVGLSINVPLDFYTISEINQGNRAAAQAAQYQAQRARFDLDQDWNELRKQYADVLVRFEVSKQLEELQKEKLEHERTRFNAGRTTSFQVLQFEEDYSNAQLQRLRIENDAIGLRAKARLYNGEVL